MAYYHITAQSFHHTGATDYHCVVDLKQRENVGKNLSVGEAQHGHSHCHHWSKKDLVALWD